MSNLDSSSKTDRLQNFMLLGEQQVAWQNRELNATHAPDKVPGTIQEPKYAIGDRCRWIPNPSTDWGTIIGYVYPLHQTKQQSDSQRSWLYLLLLDTDSPSRRWITADWVDEEDLEPLSPPRIPG